MSDALTPNERPSGGFALTPTVLVSRVAMLRHHLRPQFPDRFQSQYSVDDLIQDTLLAAARAAASFTGAEPDEFDAWLRKIADNQLIDRIRALRAAKRGGHVSTRTLPNGLTSLGDILAQVSGEQRTPSSETARAEASHLVGVLLEDLQPARRDAVRMRFVQGMEEPEIARQLGRTTSAVRSLIYRGLRDLREMMGAAHKYVSDAPSEERPSS